MDTLEIMSIAKKKCTFKNIYCSTCDEWVSEYYISCHLNGEFHERRFQKQTAMKSCYGRRFRRQNEKEKKHENFMKDYETPEQESDCYIIEGSMLKKTDDDKSRKPISPDFFKAKQRLFDKAGGDHETEPGGANEKAKKWPENLLDNTCYNGMLPWDFSDSDSTPKSVSLLVNETSH